MLGPDDGYKRYSYTCLFHLRSDLPLSAVVSSVYGVCPLSHLRLGMSGMSAAGDLRCHQAAAAAETATLSVCLSLSFASFSPHRHRNWRP